MRFRRTLLAAMTATFAIHGLKQSCADLTVHGVTVGLDVGRYDRFAGSPGFIGAGMDWSGVGRATAATGGPGWATMISPSFFVTADHTVDDVSMGAGKTLRFYANNNVNSAVDRTIATGWPLGNDLWLGKLSTPVPNTIHTYPIFNIQNPTDYAGQEIYVYGQSADVYASRAARQRLGRNVISSYAPTNQSFSFTYSASVADIAGPNGVSDGAVDSHDWDVFEANFGMSSPTHLDGDLNDNGVIDLNDGQVLFNEGLAMANVTGGLGWDEAMTEGGDSGGPSFRLIGGKPAIVGTHWESGRDRLISPSLAALAALIDTASGGTEQLVSLTGKRGTFFSTKDNLTLPVELQKLNVLRGDLNGDYVEDDDDIDFIAREIRAKLADPTRSVNWALDFNGDGTLTQADRTWLIENVLGTRRSDFNLDGVIDSLDTAIHSVNNPTPSGALHSQGDASGDGDIDVFEFSGGGDAQIHTPELGNVLIRRINADYNEDSALNGNDIDIFARAFRGESTGINVTQFDFDGDGVVQGDQDDVDYLFENVFGTLQADLNLDGQVLPLALPSGDGTIYNGNIGNNSGKWTEGDVNMDGIVDGSDLALIQFNPGYAPELPALPIPEPTGAALLVMVMTGFMTQRRRVGV